MTSEETLAELERQMREAEHGTHATIVYFGTLTDLLADSRELRRLRASLARLEAEYRQRAKECCATIVPRTYYKNFADALKTLNSEVR